MSTTATEPSSKELGDGTTSTATPDEQPNGTNGVVNGKESSPDGGNGDTAAPPVAEEKPKSPGLLAKLGVTPPLLILMLKASIPPTIGIAMLEAPAVTSYFTNFSFIIPIISILTLSMLPRGQFIQNLCLTVLAVGVGAAMAMLMLYSAVQARLNTIPAGTPPSTAYNASQSAVCGVWLFFNIWFVNTVRAKLPGFTVPSIAYSILVNVASTVGPQLPTVAAAESIIRQLLLAMLTGIGLSTGVSLFFIPIGSRLVVDGEFKGMVGLLHKMAALHKQYLIGLESEDMFAVGAQPPDENSGKKKKTSKKDADTSLAREAKLSAEILGTMRAIGQLASKMNGDLAFAKRDIAWAKLSAKELDEVYQLVRAIAIPMTGMGTVVDIFRRIAEHRGWAVDADTPPELLEEKNREKRVWNEVMKQMHEPFEILREALDQGLEHGGQLLELLPKPEAAKKDSKSKTTHSDADVEAQGDTLHPGQLGFAKVIDEKVQAFHSRKGEVLKTWAREKGLAADVSSLSTADMEKRQKDQAQLYILLYMEQFMHAAGEAVQDFVAYAETKVEDGTMKRARLILPSLSRIHKWIAGVFDGRGQNVTEQGGDLLQNNVNVVYVGDGYHGKKDPEHLPPANAWERFGNVFRTTMAFFASEECAFGFRVAAATMTIGIVAFLEQTQQFFIEQRLVWAMIMVALGMTMTSGQSIIGFILRVSGTLISMILSLVIWYIVDEKVPGIIVFFWLVTFILYFFFLKYPDLIPLVIITVITNVLIIGYELQTNQLGEAVATRSGQPAYAIYLLAPYRLATVAGGCFVSFIWTIFPSPLTDTTWLRRDLSATLYLLANYFSVINSTMHAKLNGTWGDPEDKKSPAHHLLKIRLKIFTQVMQLIPSMLQHAKWEKWEPSIGGRFPRETYEDIIKRSTRIMGYLTLMSYTLTHPSHNPGLELGLSKVSTRTKGSDGDVSAADDAAISATDDEDDKLDDKWLEALREVLGQMAPTHLQILSTLTLLSNSLSSGQSLPPFMPLPRPYEMTRRLLSMSRTPGNASVPPAFPSSHESNEPNNPLRHVDTWSGAEDKSDLTFRGGSILDAKNMGQHGYAEFAVLQVCATLVVDDLDGLVHAVSQLVGVVDFSFRVDQSDPSISDSIANEPLLVRRTTTAGGAGQKGKGKVD